MNFTEEQKHIFRFVQNGQGHGIIDAVAGAGKTTTIMESAKFIDQHQDVLFCAFNNSIANEIRLKFSRKGVSNVTTKTIHSLGFSILNSSFADGKDYVLNENKYREVIKGKIFKEKTIEYYQSIVTLNKLDPEGIYNDDRNFAIKDLIYQINKKLIDINQKFRSTLCKSKFEDFKDLTLHFGIFTSVDSNKDNFDEEINAYFNIHEVMIELGNLLAKKYKIIDFTDMIYLPFKWKLYPASRYDFLFIDECQDLSRAQLGIALKYGKKGSRVLSVGDPRQSIYGFTGADIESFDRIRNITKATDLPLTLCFRCPQLVINMAKQVRPDMDGSKSYPGVVKEIDRRDVLSIAIPGDLIISRIKAPLMEMVFFFVQKNVKVRIHQDEVKPFVSDLTRLFSRDERSEDIKLIYRGFENLKNKISQRWKWRIGKDAGRITDDDARQLYIQTEEAILEAKLEFLHDRYIKWGDKVNTIEDIVKVLKQFITAEKDSVRLSSIHRAKGLEENNIFILDYDKLPFTRPDQQDWENVQEENLKYVAITRARENLYLVGSPTPINDKFDVDDQMDSLFDEVEF